MNRSFGSAGNVGRLSRRAVVACALLMVALPFGPVARAAAPVTIEIAGALDQPDVTIEPGTVVTWINVDSERHRIRSISGPVGFDSGNLEAGQSFSITLSAEGVYRYLDDRDDENAAYHGTITVSADAPPAPPPNPGDDPDPPAAPTRGDVDIVNRVYRPAAITVQAGSEVTWTNSDDRAHTVTQRGGGFDSGIFDTGGSWSRVFANPGTFEYLCTLHPDMVGTVVVTGSGGSPDPEEPPPPPDPVPPVAPAPPPAVAPGDVGIADNSFSPASLTVPAGSTVTWSNGGSLPHTVTAAGAFDSGILMSGDTFRRTFASPGTFEYVCSLHPEMKGVVVVTGGGGSGPGEGPGQDAGAAPSPSLPAADPPASRAGGPAGIAMFDNGYTPASTTVVAGDSVTWSNTGELPHTATSTSGLFDSGIVMAGESFRTTLSQPGTYDYLCSIHPEMTGTIVVVAGGVGGDVGGDDTVPPSTLPAGAGEDLGDGSREAAPSSREQPPGTTVVSVVDNDFRPKTLRVDEGTMVRWENAGELPHTVTAEGIFDSAILAPGGVFEWTFATAGTFDYVCALHPDMVGRVIVAPAAAGRPVVAGIGGAGAPSDSLGAAVVLATALLAVAIVFAGGMAAFGRSAASEGARTQAAPSSRAPARGRVRKPN